MEYSEEEYKIERLDIIHSPFDFDCEDEEINEYFNQKSYEEVGSKNTQIYVLTLVNPPRLVGFYTLSMKSIFFEYNEKEISHPVCLLGQIGTNKIFQKQGWGIIMLNDARERCKRLSEEIGCIGLALETYKGNLVNTFFKDEGFSVIKEEKKQKGKKYTLFSKHIPEL